MCAEKLEKLEKLEELKMSEELEELKMSEEFQMSPEAKKKVIETTMEMYRKVISAATPGELKKQGITKRAIVAACLLYTLNLKKTARSNHQPKGVDRKNA